MRYEQPLLEVRLVRRYKRFLADVQADQVPEGAVQIPAEAQGSFTVHCANPGSMNGLAVSGARAWVQDSGNPKRKLRYSLELIETHQGARVCVNTARANRLVAEALDLNLISELQPHTYRTEVKWTGQDRFTGQVLEARFDFALDSGGLSNEVNSTSISPFTDHPPKGYLEVKSVTYAPDPTHQPGLVAFPDSVTTRGLKHLKALSAIAASGERAVLLFCVNRDDAEQVTIAEEIDPAYAQGIRDAREAGVEIIAYRAEATLHEHKLTRRLSFIFT